MQGTWQYLCWATKAMRSAEQERHAGGDGADGDTDLSGWRRRSQNCNGNNYDCNGVVIKIMES